MCARGGSWRVVAGRAESCGVVRLPPSAVAVGRSPGADGAMRPPPDINFNVSYDDTAANNGSLANGTASALDLFADRLATALNFYYTPLLILLGTLGNLLSVYVFYRSKLRHQSTSQYLTALAISDTIFLMQLTAPWLHAVRLSGLFHEEGFCQGFVYISYACCCVSSWLVVAFTVERFVAVLYPLKRNLLCTVARARLVILALVVCALAINIPILRFAKPTHSDCNIDVEYMDQASRFNLVDTGISFTAPLMLIIVLNVGIVIGVYRLEHARQSLLREDVESGSRQRRALAAHCAQHRVTRMLLVVSTVYVMLNFPAYTMRMVAYANNAESMTGRWPALQQIAIMFFNTNYGINFILYCLTGQNFRRALYQTVPWLGRRVGGGTATAGGAAQSRISCMSVSYASNTTEPTSALTSYGRRVRRRGAGGAAVVTRWTFDNSRQRSRPLPPKEETIELDVFSSHADAYQI